MYPGVHRLRQVVCIGYARCKARVTTVLLRPVEQRLHSTSIRYYVCRISVNQKCC